MQKMASSKHASSGNGEKLLRCAGSLFTFLGLSLMAKSKAAMLHSHSSAGQCSQPCSKTPCPQLSITLWVERGFQERCSLCFAH